MGVFCMSAENKNGYTLSVNYNDKGEGFQKILENHIKNLIKIPVRDWNLQDFNIQYKQL